MGLLRRKSAVTDLGPAHLLPAGDPGCWLVRTAVVAPPVLEPIGLPAQWRASAVTLPADVPAQAAAFAADPEAETATAEPVEDAVSTPRPARARLAALSANLSV